MKFSAALLVGAPIAFALAMTVAQGCSSEAQGLAEGAGGTTGSVIGGGGTPAAGGTGAVTPPAGGGQITCDTQPLHDTCAGANTDVSCSTAESSTGAPCTKDCRVSCGFDEMGLKVCTCAAGTYESCPCARPAEYRGAATATFCTQGGGLSTDYDGLACTTEWEQCITRDAVTGTPRGCVCKTSSETGEMEWFCGSTNNWFTLASETGDGICEGANPDLTCSGVNPDTATSCNSSNASSGSTCTMDCRVGCGYQALGLKYCTCMGGVYASCPCPKPINWMGAATAPPCVSSDGTAEALDDLPCTTEWEQCIGSELPPGTTTPRGCACLTNRITQALQWYCGSTNRWFGPQ